MPVKDGSNAPEERVNLTYRDAIGDETPQKELPLKSMVVGDFTGKPSGVPVQDRQVFAISQPTDFENVLKASNIGFDAMIDDLRESDRPTGEQLRVQLQFERLKDFEPNQIVKKVPELNRLLELREQLIELKGPLANETEFRKRVQAILEAILEEKDTDLLEAFKLGPVSQK